MVVESMDRMDRIGRMKAGLVIGLIQLILSSFFSGFHCTVNPEEPHTPAISR